MSVPENRASKSGRSISLAIARLATTSSSPRAPIVFLQGGPGQAATPMARHPRAVAQFANLRAVADVILLDQRGMGDSKPSVVCESTPPQPDSFTDAGRRRSADAARRCFTALREAGIDLSSYNTNENADDLEDLRKALGVPKISLMGFSYGTHLAIAAMRRHGSSLERVVLIGTEGPDNTWKLPSSYDTLLARLTNLVAADPAVSSDVPDFAALLRRVVKRFEEPVTVRIRDRRANADVDVAVGAAAFRGILLQDFGDATDLPYFPAMLYQLDRGDISLFRWFVDKRWNQLGGRGAAIYYAMDCASGVTASRRARIEDEATRSVFGNEMNSGYPEACATLPQLPASFRAPLVSRIPTLLVSGTLDANTPPMQAEELRWGLSDAVHIVVDNAGHEQTLVNRDVQSAIADFFAGRDVRGRTAVEPPVRFVPVSTKTRD